MGTRGRMGEREKSSLDGEGELQRGLCLCHPLLPTKARGGLGMGREITEGHSRRGAGSQSRGGGSRRLRPGDESAGS